MGPILFYMASCGSTSCDQFDPSGAKWFKISQQGLRENSPSSWYMEDIANNSPAETTLPENLAPGGYLIRHEVLNCVFDTLRMLISHTVDQSRDCYRHRWS